MTTENEFLDQLHRDLCEVFDVINGVEPEPHPGGLKDYVDQIIRQVEARLVSMRQLRAVAQLSSERSSGGREAPGANPGSPKEEGPCEVR